MLRRSRVRMAARRDDWLEMHAKVRKVSFMRRELISGHLITPRPGGRFAGFRTIIVRLRRLNA